MAEAAVTTDVPQAADVLLHLPAQGAFDGVLPVEDTGQPADVVVGEFLGAALRVDVSLFTQAQRQRRTDTVDIAQGNVRWFIVRDVDTQDTRHDSVLLLNPDAACAAGWYK